MNAVQRNSLIILAAVLLVGARASPAQQFHVTGVVRNENGEPKDLEVGPDILSGQRVIPDGARAMAFEGSGVVAVVLGPATVEFKQPPELRDGRFMFVSDRDAGPYDIVSPGSSPGAKLELEIAPGQTFVVVAEDRVQIAYVAAEASRSTELRVDDVVVPVPADRLLTVDHTGQHALGSLPDAWLSQYFDPRVGPGLGLASAQDSRRDVADRLFTNIIEWDQYAGAEHVVPLLSPRLVGPEIRQTVQVAATVSRVATRGGSFETRPPGGANEVPLLSPAAASVQNLRGVGQGVTAIELNRQARMLLTQTGSRGLGFGGLRQLAIPGFFGPDLRTVGPPGLGGRP